MSESHTQVRPEAAALFGETVDQLIAFVEQVSRAQQQIDLVGDVDPHRHIGQDIAAGAVVARGVIRLLDVTVQRLEAASTLGVRVTRDPIRQSA
jgi:hypothetical protein